MTDYNIPKLIKQGIDRYAKKGVPTGGFLKAVLCNDLFEAVGRAGDESESALKQIVQYVYNEIPGNCWGSLEQYDAWIEKHIAKRQKEQDALLQDANQEMLGNDDANYFENAGIDDIGAK